jgi:hypothetical protein
VRYVCGRPRVVSPADRIAIVSSLRRFDAPSAPSPEYSNQSFVEITAQVSAWVAKQKIATGLLTIFRRHTSASLLIQENADPDVQKDLESFFNEIAPEDGKRDAKNGNWSPGSFGIATHAGDHDFGGAAAREETTGDESNTITSVTIPGPRSLRASRPFRTQLRSGAGSYSPSSMRRIAPIRTPRRPVGFSVR